MAEDFEVQPGAEGADPDVAASESFLDSVVEDAAADAGRQPAPREAESTAPATEHTPDHVTHWRQRYEARQATEKALREAREGQAQLRNELAAIRQQVAQGPQPKAPNADPEPPFYDPKDPDSTRKWYLWRDRESARQQQGNLVQALGPIYQYMLGQMQTAQHQQQTVQQQQVAQGEAGRVQGLEREYAAAVPAYTAVVDDATKKMSTAYQAAGHDPHSAYVLAVKDLHAVWQRGEQAGYHPAQYLHHLLTYGSHPGGNGAQPASPGAPPAASRRVRDMRAAASAPEAGSLSQGGTAPTTVGAVAKLTNHGRGAADPNAVRRSGVDVDDIYRVAFQQELNGQ